MLRGKEVNEANIYMLSFVIHRIFRDNYSDVSNIRVFQGSIFLLVYICMYIMEIWHMELTLIFKGLSCSAWWERECKI